MTTGISPEPDLDVLARAKDSAGKSSNAILKMVRMALKGRVASGGTLLDVGCGTGDLAAAVGDLFDRYQGADVIRHEGLPEGVEFFPVDLDRGGVSLPDGHADTVAAVETIEHLENPRAFMRELTRLAKPGGWVVVTTPNQLSLLSKLTLLLKNEFNAFRDGSYPAHLTALLEVDLRRIGAECGLEQIEITYSRRGRMPGTRWSWPGLLSGCAPRLFSDNVLMVGKKYARRTGSGET